MKTVLITVDALRPDHLSQYGYKRETMPVLDRLVDEGVRFENAFANGTNTGVSVPSLLSSRYFGVDAVESGPNLASVLAESGVATAGFHSNSLFSNRVDYVQGFDKYEDFEKVMDHNGENKSPLVRVYDGIVNFFRPLSERFGVRKYAEVVQESIFPSSLIHESTTYIDAETVTNEAVDWLKNHAGEDFFLWVHYMDPHRPYGVDIDDPAFGEPIEDAEIQNLMSKAGIRPSEITSGEREQMIDLYDSDIRYTSQHIARLFDAFEDLDIWDETAITLTADHGEEFGEHGHYYHRNYPYDELLHVPLFTKHPDRSGQRVIQKQRELLDLAPTICEWHGVSCPREFKGVPLSKDVDRQVIATGSFVAEGHVVAGRWDGWKYIWPETEEEKLYNLDLDPGEKKNVFDENQKVATEFEQSIPKEIFEAKPVSINSEDAAMRRRLSELGYLE